jgi:uncharacterized membrane protein
MFAVMSVVAASSSWVPFSAFVASILHFCVSSWLFLSFPRTGKISAMVTGAAMSLWPFTAFVGSVLAGEAWAVAIYALPLLLNGVVMYYHYATFNHNLKPILGVRILISTPSLMVLIAFIVYYAQYLE